MKLPDGYDLITWQIREGAHAFCVLQDGHARPVIHGGGVDHEHCEAKAADAVRRLEDMRKTRRVVALFLGEEDRA